MQVAEGGVAPGRGPAVCAARPSGRAAVYAVKAPEGAERAAAARLSRLLPPGLLAEAVFPRKERWFKRGGKWSLQAKPMWAGYLLVSTADARGLDEALRRLSRPLSLAGLMPMDPGAAAWLWACMDASHVVRASVAYRTDGGGLRAVSGPLVGREGSVVRYDRHKRTCLVAVTAAGAQGPCESLALDVPDGEAPAWL